ncbi:MaoC family dehydratase [Pseudoruegeria sp. SK021]|uniref:MaoC family dehydratase n=1 Tax=Pseudoruegeria sp. SK021 TaxID=1933035 RepID=UPI000A25FFDE|nr:MaoC family dehydratase [Pseudoruegeria sp. SK021]OSP54163.1 hypothetical protein BV911_13990 [Pseudoruegeria sp. SK021]
MTDRIFSTVFLEDMAIGMERSLSKCFGFDDVLKFADVSEDHNPIHLCEQAGAASIFKERIVHGMLCGSLFSALLGEHLPGQGTIYLGQTLNFHAPVRLDDTVTAKVTVQSMQVDRRRVTLRCEAWVGETLVTSGEATVLAPSRA